MAVTTYEVNCENCRINTRVKNGWKRIYGVSFDPPKYSLYCEKCHEMFTGQCVKMRFDEEKNKSVSTYSAHGCNMPGQFVAPPEIDRKKLECLTICPGCRKDSLNWKIVREVEGGCEGYEWTNPEFKEEFAPKNSVSITIPTPKGSNMPPVEFTWDDRKKDD